VWVRQIKYNHFRKRGDIRFQEEKLKNLDHTEENLKNYQEEKYTNTLKLRSNFVGFQTGKYGVKRNKHTASWAV